MHVYIQGPAVRALTRKFRPRLKGWVATGHIPAQEKLRQLSRLGANLYVCDGSVQPFRVKPEDFIFDGLQIVEYLTFMSIMEDADIHIST